MTNAFGADFIGGLRTTPKRIASKWFYDSAGCALFDRITELDEYYPTRTELAIIEEYAPDMAGVLGKGVLLFEFGSGSSLKTRLLLGALERPAAYVPIDIAADHLEATARALRTDYPGVPVHPIAADFTAGVFLPDVSPQPARRVAYFPGSTIGNFTPPAAIAFLRRVAAQAGPGGGLLIGIDLVKDKALLERAYNDAAGVTAAFNLNLLARANREIHAGFDLDAFRHVAFFDPAESRIEMHIESLRDQSVTIAGAEVGFVAGERILTEYSHKYDVGAFSQLARRAGFEPTRVWTDARRWFAVLMLDVVAD